MDATQSIIAELEDAISGGSLQKRADTLRRATDLFLREVERRTEAQSAVCSCMMRLPHAGMALQRGRWMPLS